MKNLIIIGLIAAAGYYYFEGRSSACNSAKDVEKKAMELMEKFQDVAFGGGAKGGINPNKLIAKMQKMQNLQTRSNDYQAQCDAIDDLMDEL